MGDCLNFEARHCNHPSLSVVFTLFRVVQKVVSFSPTAASPLARMPFEMCGTGTLTIKSSPFVILGTV